MNDCASLTQRCRDKSSPGIFRLAILQVDQQIAQHQFAPMLQDCMRSSSGALWSALTHHGACAHEAATKSQLLPCLPRLPHLLPTETWVTRASLEPSRDGLLSSPNALDHLVVVPEDGTGKCAAQHVWAELRRTSTTVIIVETGALILVSLMLLIHQKCTYCFINKTYIVFCLRKLVHEYIHTAWYSCLVMCFKS